MKNNDTLKKAKKNKNDEFYTQLIDIERELQYYEKHFAGKTIFCNCDNPVNSNFYKYFVDNFKRLKIKKVIASCYVDCSINLFNSNEDNHGFYYEYTGKESEKKYPNMEDVTFFKSNGDFRSEESINILQNSDIVVTNPPFSLFREFLSILNRYNKKYIIIGNINAITYKETFNLIEQNKVWLGVNMGRGISGFIVPDHYKLYGTETKINEYGQKVVSTNNSLWLTNLDNERRHQDILLTKTYAGNEESYPHYDNYDGINVDRTANIPRDYSKAMGVPITFLHKYNPDQFEILGFRKGNDGKDLSINGKNPYFRILIRNKRL